MTNESLSPSSSAELPAVPLQTLSSPRNQPALEALAAEARRDLERKGYCGNNLEWRPDAYGFAAPLGRPYQSLLYVFNCGVPAQDGPYRERAADIGPRLVALARETERLLGYS